MLNPGEEEQYSWQIFSVLDESDNNQERTLPVDWQLNAGGRLNLNLDALQDKQIARIDLQYLQAKCAIEIPIVEYNQKLLKDRYQYGPGFVWVERVWAADNEALAQMRQPSMVDASYNLVIPPGLIDCCFQAMTACIREQEQGMANLDIAYIPVGI